jgi:hypothetical protein
VKGWLQRQLDPLRTAGRLAVVLDREELLEARDLESWGESLEVRDWYELRRAYEQAGRRRTAESDRLVIFVHSDAYSENRDLPYDIERAAVVIRARVPVAPAFREIVLELDDNMSDRAVEVLGAPRHGDLDDVLGELWGVRLPGDSDEARELEAVVQLRADPTVPPALWPALAGRLSSPMTKALASIPPDAGPAEEAWADYARSGSASAHAPTFERIGPRLTPAFHAGLLRPAARGSAELPAWAAPGLAEVSGAELVRSLLATPPQPDAPADLSGWVAVAEWWGQVRAGMASLGHDPGGLREQVWDVWRGYDTAFGTWLRAAYGGLLLSSSALPLTVDRVAGFLARRLRHGEVQRLLLVVLDGLGFAQWAILQREARLRVLESHACLAMIPTLTPVSRQAIFRGALPMYYPKTIEKTSADGVGWTSFWVEQGLAPRSVQYHLVTGAGTEPLSLQPGVTAVGVVVQAIDKMLHGANVFGDAQLSASVRAWLDRGYLEGLVGSAAEAGYEVWLTSDHGNLETTPLGRAAEGLTVETAGLRVRLYGSAELREGSRLKEGGFAWDAPGLPDGWRYPLFSPGRGAYFSGEVRLTHGGISLDEVIVPMVKVAPS